MMNINWKLVALYTATLAPFAIGTGIGLAMIVG